MARSKHNYIQYVIGDCGHVCMAWPLVGSLGSGKTQVICDECTKEIYGIDSEDELAVWVRVKEPPSKPVAEAKPKKTAVKKSRCFLCQKTGHTYLDCPLMNGQGVLDGT